MVERAIAQRRMLTEYILLKEELAERRGAPRIIGEDPKLRQVSQQLHRAAATDATVLLEGESGTGKELFARALHALSPRADGPFVAINCAAIPDTLLETELFGHEKGAFTGAGGAQARPLRAGASRHAVPRRDRRPAARAAGQDPARARGEAVRARRRHAVAARRRARRRGDQPQPEAARGRAPVPRGSVLPAVGVSDPDSAAARARGRRGDPGAALRRQVLPRSEQEAADAVAGARSTSCSAYPWPGNVRELQNCIERAVILCDGDTIHPRHLNLSFRQARAAAPSPARGSRSICRARCRCAAPRDGGSRAAEDRAGAAGLPAATRPRWPTRCRSATRCCCRS